MVKYISGTIRVDAVVCFIFGVIFLSVMLGFAVAFPNPSSFQVQVFMAALSLAAAGVGAAIPGIDALRYKGVIRASGAIVLFLIVWFSRPILAEKVIHLEQPTVPMESVATNFLNKLDQRDISGTYELISKEAKDYFSLTLADWKAMSEFNITPLGSLNYRKTVGVSAMKADGSQLPIGYYRQTRYVSQYTGTDGCRFEQLTGRATQSLDWEIFSYEISTFPVNCPIF